MNKNTIKVKKTEVRKNPCDLILWSLFSKSYDGKEKSQQSKNSKNAISAVLRTHVGHYNAPYQSEYKRH